MEEGNILRIILEQEMEEGTLRQELESMGLQATYENGVRLQLVRRAAGGDLSAAKYVLGVLEAEQAEMLKPGTDLSTVPTAVLRQMAAGWEK